MCPADSYEKSTKGLLFVNSQHNLLSVQHVDRTFHNGEVHAVRDVSLHIDAGSILALVGVNGAGKTTLVKMCSTLLAPTSGSISVDGIDAVRHPQDARRKLGLVLGGDKGFYPRSTVLNNMRFFADLAEIPYRTRDKEIRLQLERVALSEQLRTRVGDLSRGQRQRLHIARALLGSPPLLLLDEPTIGLDPDVALRIRDVIRDIVNQGVGMLLTSHSMMEVQELAQRVAIMQAGSIVAEGTLQDIYNHSGIYMTTMFALQPTVGIDADEVSQWFADEAHVMCRPSGSLWLYTVFWKNEHTQAQYNTMLQRIIATHNCPQPIDVTMRPVNLEDAFLAITHQSSK